MAYERSGIFELTKGMETIGSKAERTSGKSSFEKIRDGLGELRANGGSSHRPDSSHTSVSVQKSDAPSGQSNLIGTW